MSLASAAATVLTRGARLRTSAVCWLTAGIPLLLPAGTALLLPAVIRLIARNCRALPRTFIIGVLPAVPAWRNDGPLRVLRRGNTG